MPSLKLRDGVDAVEPKKFVIGGLVVYTYAGELDPSKPLSFVVVAHPRCLDYKYAEVLCREIVHAVPNAICATFDLPNHGTRTVSKLSNEDWKEGNPTHAQNMLSVIDQAAAEVEMVAEYLPSYIGVLAQAVSNKTAVPLVTGVSLGGHISWKVGVGRFGASGNNYIKGIAPIIGCPDTLQMLKDRYAIQVTGGSDFPTLPPNAYQDRVDLIGKPFPVLALCGADDTLVPASYTEQWAKEGTLAANQIVYVQPKTGHECTPEMIDMLCDWINGLANRNQ
ncbi:hypothetical protein B9G98_00649 [Wickerhamiella sorbophila]|uniref:Acyl-protein thioesterase 1 n=1 Tax=Wickerhamiella sorbophila TaxID=45607 RepID=A0A2T0FDL2_9ASCO|nr:hypothetical protein B9G98_00649 [Wickerhamiella sorbophila]PRT53029.1 hypothetical protein B9G98_00649 [Wickerhamiella sorbophila]